MTGKSLKRSRSSTEGSEGCKRPRLSTESRKRSRLSTESQEPEKKVTTSLIDIPDVPALIIASFLRGKDFLNFSHSCQRIFHICETDKKLWRRQLGFQNFPLCQEISDAALRLVNSGASTYTKNGAKLTYFMHMKTRETWRTEKFTQKAKIPKGNVTRRSFHGPERAGSPQVKGRGSSRRFSFNTWDVKSGTSKTYDLNAPLAMEMFDDTDTDVKDYFTAGSVIIIQFRGADSDLIHFCALKLDEETLQAKDLWNFSTHFNEQLFYYNCDSKKESFYLFTCNGSELLVQGFTLQTGSQFLNHTIVHKEAIYDVPGPFISHENWIVFACNGGRNAFALDTVRKSHTILLQLYETCALAVKDGKALGCGKDGLAMIWDLATGEPEYVNPPESSDSSMITGIFHFAGNEYSVTETINRPGRVPAQIFRTVRLDRPLQKIHNKSFTIGPDWPTSVRVIGDSFVFDFAFRFDFGPSLLKPKQSSITLFPVYGTKNSSFKLMQEKEYFEIEWMGVYQTYISIAAGSKIHVLDFLNVEQFVKK